MSGVQTGFFFDSIYVRFSRLIIFWISQFFLISILPSLLHSQLFKEELTQVKEGMKQINDLAHQLAISDVHLSMENARALEHLNSRWKVLQVEFRARSELPIWRRQQ